MDTLECIRSRRSVRRFQQRDVELDKVEILLDAARLAPSAGNLQDRKFIVVRDEAAKKRVAEACLQQWWVEAAPIIIVICSEWKQNERMYGPKGERYSQHGAAASAQNVLLAAHDIGLAACWVGAFEDEQLRRHLKIPDDVIPVAVIPVGYADESPKEPPKSGVDQLTSLDAWNVKLKEPGPAIESAIKEVQRAANKAVSDLKELAARKKK